jgi:hypothetical protein
MSTIFNNSKTAILKLNLQISSRNIPRNSENRSSFSVSGTKIQEDIL